MQFKQFGTMIKAPDAQGVGTALFSTFNVIDKDDDVTLPGAINGGPVVISSWGHKSWEGAMPIGRGNIRTDATAAYVDFQLFMDTAHGGDAYRAMKQLDELVQWSYGFDIEASEAGVVDGKNVRILKSLNVHEVSPVLVGAGVGTGTLAMKGYGAEESVNRDVLITELRRFEQMQREEMCKAVMQVAKTTLTLEEDRVVQEMIDLRNSMFRPRGI